MFVTLWEFEVKPGSEELFEQAYGPEGEWVRLFQRAERYRGTRLLREVGAARVYLTLDLWESREAYKDFRGVHAAEYRKLDEEFEGLTASERHLCEFES